MQEDKIDVEFIKKSWQKKDYITTARRAVKKQTLQ